MNRSAYYICTLALLVLTSSFLSSCTQSGNSSSTLSNTQSSNLTIDSVSVVPVLDGMPTTTGVYIHNNTNHDITDIHYGVVNQKSSSLVINQTSCKLVKANSTCLLQFTTPRLEALNSGSDLITANYNNEQSSQLINYQYVDSSKYNGVTFGGSSIDLIGMRDYATVYAFVGKNATARSVGFDVSNNSVGIVNGLTGSKIDIGSNEVIALELMTNQNITANHVTITPTVSSSQTSIQSLNSNILNVAIIPTNNANLIMSNVAVLNSNNQTATVMVYNNGKSAATSLNLTSSNPSIVSVSGANGSCLTTPSLSPNNSCSYEVSLVNLTSNGSVLLSLTSSANTKTNTVYYTGSQSAPMIGIVPGFSNLVESVNTSKSLVFDVTNYSNVALTNVSFTLVNRLINTNVSITNNTCGSTITSSCQITASVVTGALIDEGMFYILMTGEANSQDYSFVSTPVNVTVVETLPELVSIIPNNAELDISLATGLTLNFSEPMNPLTLTNTNIKLFRESDNVEVGLTSQGVSNNNQTVIFTQSSGALGSNTNYKVVTNPSAIKNSVGNAMDINLSESVVSIFKTIDIDVISPTIVNYVPMTGESNVSKTPTMTVQFSESMDVTTLNTTSIKLSDSDDNIFNDYTIRYDTGSYTAVLELTNGAVLSSESAYKINLNESMIKDNNGNSLGNNTNYLLTRFTVGDYIAPTIVLVSPLNGATEVLVNTKVGLTFSESMDISTLTNVNILLKRNLDNTLITLDNPIYSNDNHSVDLSPTSLLTRGESYTVVIKPNQIKDLTGNVISIQAESVIAIFEAEHVFAVTGTSPVNKGIVPSSQNFVTIMFSNSVDITTVNSTTVTLVESETVSPNYVGVCSLITNKEAQCNLVESLGANKEYILTIDSAIKSMTNENLLSSEVATFMAMYISPQQRLASGAGYGCMLNSYGNAYCWGDNTRGSLGTGNNTNSNSPTLVKQGEIPLNTPIIAISAGTALRGYGTTCAIAANARAYCWGDNEDYAVGNGTTSPNGYNIPKAIATKDTDSRSAIPVNTKIIAIDSTNVMTCALDNLGQAYCWGKVSLDSVNGYLGDASGTRSSTVPVKVDQSISGAFIQISVGGGSACAINESHEAYCWGGNTYGQLGSNGTTAQKTPAKVSAGQMPESVSFSVISIGKDNAGNSGAVASCAIATDNKAYCWGSNNQGQLGINTTTNNTTNRTPRQVFTSEDNVNSAISSTESLVSISAGSRSNCAIGATGIGYCWGANGYGQLGIGSTTSSNVAKQVSSVTGFLSLITGFDNYPNTEPALSCGLSIEGDFYCWGKNNFGQVGIGTTGGQYTTSQKLTIP